MENRGRLTCIGLGIRFTGQITDYAKSVMEHADVVFHNANTAISEDVIKKYNTNVVSLLPCYQEHEYRGDVYHLMKEKVVASVKAGSKVCWAFYGHPAVGVTPSHDALQELRAEGYKAEMEPGISAESCLYADLTIDPIADGVAHYEASHFLFFHHEVDVTAYLVLWQIAIAGDFSATLFTQTQEYLEVMVQYLCRWYPPEHKVIAYEAAELPVFPHRADSFELQELPKVKLRQYTTLVIPPIEKRQVNSDILDLLKVPNDHPLRR